MRIAVISDVHANMEALLAILGKINNSNVNATYCLGDIVGYGADPKSCLDLVQSSCAGVVRGNHDEVVATGQGMDVLPHDGRIAAQLHKEMLSDDDLAYLRSLPFRIDMHGCTFCHASPENPASWQRLTSYSAARRQFAHFETDMCFIGHTHVPAILSEQLGIFHVRPGHRFLVNVGSVGQPRDRDPRAGFGIFDVETFRFELVRVPYDVDKAADKIVRAGLPSSLAKRIHCGN